MRLPARSGTQRTHPGARLVLRAQRCGNVGGQARRGLVAPGGCAQVHGAHVVPARLVLILAWARLVCLTVCHLLGARAAPCADAEPARQGALRGVGLRRGAVRNHTGVVAPRNSWFSCSSRGHAPLVQACWRISPTAQPRDWRRRPWRSRRRSPPRRCAARRREPAWSAQRPLPSRRRCPAPRSSRALLATRAPCQAAGASVHRSRPREARVRPCLLWANGEGKTARWRQQQRRRKPRTVWGGRLAEAARTERVAAREEPAPAASACEASAPLRGAIPRSLRTADTPHSAKSGRGLLPAARDHAAGCTSRPGTPKGGDAAWPGWPTCNLLSAGTVRYTPALTPPSRRRRRHGAQPLQQQPLEQQPVEQPQQKQEPLSSSPQQEQEPAPRQRPVRAGATGSATPRGRRGCRSAGARRLRAARTRALSLARP